MARVFLDLEKRSLTRMKPETRIIGEYQLVPVKIHGCGLGRDFYRYNVYHRHKLIATWHTLNSAKYLIKTLEAEK